MIHGVDIIENCNRPLYSFFDAAISELGRTVNVIAHLASGGISLPIEAKTLNISKVLSIK